VPYLPQPKEDNPFLGVRGIRLCLRKPELFLPQLSRHLPCPRFTGPVKINVPMIATLGRPRAAKAWRKRVRAELGAPPVEIGIMIEVPSAVVMAAEFARSATSSPSETIDLTNMRWPWIAPSRIWRAGRWPPPRRARMIDQTVRGAQSAKEMGRAVCGGLAATPAARSSHRPASPS